jgi:DNA-nicking Smr family endonuclease
VSKGGRGLTEDEKKLWRRVAARVRPRRQTIESETAESTPRAKPPAKRAHAPALQQPKRAPPAPPQDRGAEKRVRRGRVEIGGTLDLHGHTQHSARAALIRFLHAMAARGARTVIVVTGAGRSGQGVLKQRLPEWLAQGELRQIVSGFAQAHRAHGGDGAFYVFLRVRPR